MDKAKYTYKCLEILETNQFTKLNHDPTKSVEGKIQTFRRKFKYRLSQKEYYQIYPTGSCAGTASYQLAKYLAQLLPPLTRSGYTVNSTKDLIVKIKNEKVPQNCNMVSFDVKSLFTSVPLEYTIDIIIKRVFEDHEITTIFTKSEMKKPLTLYTKNVHFSFNNEICIHIDGVPMGSPMETMIANIYLWLNLRLL